MRVSVCGDRVLCEELIALRPTELAKVDPSVSVLCDVHNTLVNTVLRKYASDFLKEKYLPQLSSSKVRSVLGLRKTRS